MPKGFSDAQMVRIKQALLDAGMKRINTTGVKKTTIEDLTTATGISKGAFYKFYSSKEALFFEILEIYEKRVKDKFLELMVGIKNDLPEELKKAISSLVFSREMKDYLSIIKKEELDYLLRAIEPEAAREHIGKDNQFMLEVIKNLSSLGLVVKGTPDLILSYLQALFCLFYEYELIGERHFRRIIDDFIDTLINAALNG